MNRVLILVVLGALTLGCPAPGDGQAVAPSPKGKLEAFSSPSDGNPIPTKLRGNWIVAKANKVTLFDPKKDKSLILGPSSITLIGTEWPASVATDEGREKDSILLKLETAPGQHVLCLLSDGDPIVDNSGVSWDFLLVESFDSKGDPLWSVVATRETR